MEKEDFSKYSDRDLLVSLHTRVGMITTAIDDHETRIRSGEEKDSELQGSIRGLSWAGGITTLVIAVVSFFGWQHK